MSKAETSERHHREFMEKLDEVGMTRDEYKGCMSLVYCAAVLPSFAAPLTY